MSVSHHALGHAAQEHARKAAAPSTPDHDQVRRPGFGAADDLGIGRATLEELLYLGAARYLGHAPLERFAGDLLQL